MGHDDADTLLPDTLLSTTSKEIAWLCCGIGDARNLLATIFYLGISRSRKASHFTLVDLKPAVFARDLLIFRLDLDFETQRDDGHDPSVDFTPQEVVSTLFGAIPQKLPGVVLA